MYGSTRGTYPSNVSATIGGVGGTPLGQAAIALTVDDAAPPQLTVVQGSGQKAVIGTTYAQPFGLRVTRSGAPIANAVVTFHVCDGTRDTTFCAGAPITASGTFTGGYDGVNIISDADGYAFTPAFKAGWGVGQGSVLAYVGSTKDGTATFAYTNTNAQGGLTLDVQDLWWVGPSEAGWGLSVTQHGDKLFSLLFGYDDAGAATWWVMDDGQWNHGVGSTFNGFLDKARATPFYAYDTRSFVPERVGSALLGFEGGQGFIGGGVRSSNPDFPHGVSKFLQRFDFTTDPNEPMRSVADLWWGGPNQSGWGLAIFERPGNLFAMWFTYDDAGRPTGFVMPQGQWTTAKEFEGRIYSARGSGWVGSEYDTSKFQTTDVGAFRLRFLGGAGAELQYNVDGRAGTLALERFPF